MAHLLHHLIFDQATHGPTATALVHKKDELDYGGLAGAVSRFAAALHDLGVARGERVATWLPKGLEAAIALFGAAAAGAVFVPVNPLLKPPQVGYILRDCNVRVVVTSADRAAQIEAVMADCPDLHSAVIAGGEAAAGAVGHVQRLSWGSLMAAQTTERGRDGGVIDTDLAALLYTSGSTGRPKGVALTHHNMVAGAASVASYLGNTPEDRLLAVLPLSFDYGFSQLSTAFTAGAAAVLMDYLLPRDVIRAVARQGITGLAGVPPLWVQLARLEWPAGARQTLRYITNSGGAMPRAVTDALRATLPRTRVFLMYGLTEAFRSTYLPPEELDRRPDSMGRAIPNAEVMVVREDGSPCAAGEPGELVHRGALVARGYWNDPERTAERFRPAPGQAPELALPELAVWSGDTVRRDEEGFLYFVARRDEMIKTSGYRVSPTEVEEVLYASGLTDEAVALGLPHPELGQGILAVVKPAHPPLDTEALLAACKRELPGFMVPLQVEALPALPRNPNGKIDRKDLSDRYREAFAPDAESGPA